MVLLHSPVLPSVLAGRRPLCSKTALHMDGWLTPKEKGPAAIVVGLTGRLVFM